jgi:hypothetical protein
VIAKESSPEFARLIPRIQAQQIPGNSSFGDVKAELVELTVNSRSAPGRILVHHPLDETSKLGIDLGPAATLCLRSKAPEQTKASPVPADNRFRFDDNQNVSPRRPKAAEQDPKYAILNS